LCRWVERVKRVGAGFAPWASAEVGWGTRTRTAETDMSDPSDRLADPEPLPDEAEENPGPRWHGRSFLSGLTVGALLGGGLVLFLSSGRGREVTRRVSRHWRDLERDARREWDDLREQARREIRRRKRDLRASL
ncbi:MAG: hypothetical protein ACREMO_10620, partial [Gemmatimonadales bacterium]